MAGMAEADRVKMRAAQTLIREQRYDEARTLLQGIRHAKAHEWLQRLNQIAPSYSPPPPAQQYYAPQSFTTKLIVSILLLFVFVLPGLIALVVFSREAKNAQEHSAYPIPGAQELITLNRVVFVLFFVVLALLILFMLLPLINYSL